MLVFTVIMHQVIFHQKATRYLKNAFIKNEVGPWKKKSCFRKHMNILVTEKSAQKYKSASIHWVFGSELLKWQIEMSAWSEIMQMCVFLWKSFTGWSFRWMLPQGELRRIFCTFVHRGWLQLCTHFAWGLLGSDFKETRISRCDTKNKNQLGELCTHQTGTLLSNYWLIITVCIRVNDLEGLSYDDKTILFETVFLPIMSAIH